MADIIAPAPTPAADFRRMSAEGEVHVLSTGRIVRQRPVTLLRLIKAGKVPDHLTSYVVTLVWGSDKNDERSDQQKAIEYLEYLDFIAGVSLLDPVIAATPKGKNEISVEDLTFAELQQIRDWALQPHAFEEVKTFPVEQDGGVEPGAKGGEGEQTAE